MSRPSTVSSAHLVRYSCARWIGLRVWKPTTRFQPRSAKSARVSAGSLWSSREVGLGPLEDGHRPGEVRGLLRVELRDAGMLAVGRAEALLRLALLVVGEDLLDLEHRERAAALVRERDAVARRRLGHGEADGQRPGQPVGEPHRLDDALVVRLAHEAGQRRERARGEHVQVGQLARGQRDDLERVEVVGALARARSTSDAAVRADQLVGRDGAHARTSGPTRPSSSSSGDDDLRALLGSLRLGVDHDLGALRRLVRVVDAGEALDLAGEGLRVETVDVAPRALLDRRVDVDLDEGPERLHHLARLLARLVVRARSRR